MKCWVFWLLYFVFQHIKNDAMEVGATVQCKKDKKNDTMKGEKIVQCHTNEETKKGQCNEASTSESEQPTNFNETLCPKAKNQNNSNAKEKGKGFFQALQELNDDSDGFKHLKICCKTFQSGTSNVAVIQMHGTFNGLEIYANDTQVDVNTDVSKRKVKVGLPKELDVGENNTIVFTIIQLSNETALTSSDELYEGRLIGVSVSGKTISGLRERVNITKTQEPQCVFLNLSTETFERDGCETLLNHMLNEITCSCDHLTYFAVLLVAVSEGTLSPVDQKILSYITIIGCSISLFALVITVLIFITNRQFREDDSKKIHISLSVALILLNLHFLPSEAVAAMSSYGFCLYMALGLHYSLLATFSWMALEGFHLYLLLVKVFNIYVRRYLLKLSLVGWGVPVVIVSVVVIIDKDYYGHAPVDVSNPNGSAICYLTDDIVKLGSTVGVFAVVFLFNVIMFGITIKWFVKARSSKEIGQSARNSARKEICTLLSVMVLLGITWGLVFFSFGPLTTPGLYAFCILNSLQGLVIFIYFILSLKKPKDSAANQSSETTS